MLQSWNKVRHVAFFQPSMSSMITQFCFTGGYIEVSISLPGSSTVRGFWPGACEHSRLLSIASLPLTRLQGSITPSVLLSKHANRSQTLGNLARAGYGATTDGTWPFSYNTCDVGTMRNQTNLDGTPAAARTGGGYGGALSYQPGQRLSCVASHLLIA